MVPVPGSVGVAIAVVRRIPVPHEPGAIVEAPGLVVVEPEGLAPVDVEVPLVEAADEVLAVRGRVDEHAVAASAARGEVAVRPDAEAEVAEVGGDVEVQLGVALGDGLGVHQRAVEAVAGVETVVAEAPDDRSRLGLSLGSVLVFLGDGSHRSRGARRNQQFFHVNPFGFHVLWWVVGNYEVYYTIFFVSPLTAGYWLLAAGCCSTSNGYWPMAGRISSGSLGAARSRMRSSLDSMRSSFASAAAAFASSAAKISGVKWSPAVGAATDPTSRA